MTVHHPTVVPLFPCAPALPRSRGVCGHMSRHCRANAPCHCPMDALPTGRRFSAAEALSFGLVSRVCKDQDELMASATELAVNIASESLLCPCCAPCCAPCCVPAVCDTDGR